MENHSVRNGLLLGASSVVFSLILYLMSPQFMLTWGSWAGIVIMIYFMRKSIVDSKIDFNGFISLGQAFKASWLTYILGTVITTIFSYVLINYIDPSLIDVLKATQISALEKMGETFNMPEDALQEQISAIEDTNPFGPAALAIALPVSFLFPGAVIAIIMAAIMKKVEPIV